jgi:hypothetical protein
VNRTLKLSDAIRHELHDHLPIVVELMAAGPTAEQCAEQPGREEAR